MAAPALWYPKSSIDKNFDAFLLELKKYQGKDIILYCRSGRRVSVVVEKLAELNIFAWNMGAYQDWLEQGYPIKK